MGLRGIGSKPKAAAKAKAPRRRRRPAWSAKGLSRVERVTKFIEGLRITSGVHAGRRFRLRPWQRTIISEWYATDRQGRRVVRTGLLSLGRKNGKTALAAALALCHLVGPEQERRGQIVVGATDRDQATLLFDEVRAFIADNPGFEAECNVQRFAKVIEHLPSGSTLKALSSDARKAHGMSPSVVILDELAQWGSGAGRALYEALTTAGGARAEPLVIVISTQSADDHSVMAQLTDYGKSVRAGSIEDPTFSAHVFEVAEALDVFDEKNWPLANPALGDFRSIEDMRAQAKRARHMPALEAAFRNLCCNQRTQAEEHWIPAAEWDSCRGGVNLEALAGERCFGGLDLGSVRDLTAFALFWPDSGSLAVWSWCPADGLREREDSDRVPYGVWASRGHIETTPGRATDKRRVAMRLGELYSRFKPEAIAYDLWGMAELERVLADEGVSLGELRAFGQGFKSMSPAVKAFEERVLNRRLMHGGNPLLTWAVSNVALERDAAGNVKLSKERSRERIDPAVAAVMAVGIAAQAPTAEEEPQYQFMVI